MVGKDTPADTSFKILNLPAGQVPTSDFAADDFGRVLSVFLLDDVKKDGTIALPPDKTIRAAFEGFDGFKIGLDYAEIDGQNWVKIRGEAPPAAPAQAERQAPAGEPPADWARTIATINARAEGWVFQVPAYEVNALKKKMAELAKKPDAESTPKI
jgi:hypothetical protein